MTILKLDPLSNGAIANQTKEGNFKTIPEGWIAVPEEFEAVTLSLLPWVSLTTSDGIINGVSENLDAKTAWIEYSESLVHDDIDEGGEG